MIEPITTALIVGLAAQKFAEGAAGKAAEKLTERLWETISNRFTGRKKVEEVLIQVETSQGNDLESQSNLVRVLDAELFEDEEFAQEVKQLAQQIVHIQNQYQSQQVNANYGRDQFVINQPSGDLKLGGS
ncbi:hypothetical protein [[Limnothrix rosea] IAM M-220]|uniref:hypothetical protein n=1 Tax=[Limnothrix rosea] IAM M-220 TaxID=454133 RepID=UPI000969FA58|nr:hypothetical protein [[Limnothrix rosea] IAM M-220]OKH17869.1 hypothetical protein NIES208_07665 [[Limnothrix rosea] IAM M-220]